MNSSVAAVREARDDEHTLCRCILPECFFPAAAPELFVAVGTDETIQAAAAVLWTAGGFPVQLRVLESFRRRGVGRLLLDAVSAACRGETGTLRSWLPVPEGGAGAEFLDAMGFAVERRLNGFESEGGTVMEEARRLRALLQRSGRVPPDAGVVALQEAPAQEVAQLVGREFRTAPAFVSAQLGTGAVYDPSHSVVTTRAGRVVGVVLAVRENDCLRIDVNVVAPDHRHGWTNLLQLLCTVERGLDAGVSRFRFICDDATPDTLNIAQRLGARALERALLFSKSLT